MKHDEQGRGAARRMTAGYDMGGLTQPEGYARGGHVKETAGAGGGEGRLAKARAVGAEFKRGGKVKEGSKEDVAEDKRDAKKAGMSMKKWEKSDADKKQDAEGFARGGKVGRKQMGAIRRKDAAKVAVPMAPPMQPSAPGALDEDAGTPSPYKRGGSARKR